MEQDTRDRIITAATKHFADKGYAGGRVDEIARMAGVNKATIYYHIGGKDETYVEVLKCTFTKITEMLREGVDKADGHVEKLKAFIEVLHRFKQENADFPSVMLHEVASGGEHITSEVMDIVSGVLSIFSQILKDGENAGVFRKVNPIMAYYMVLGHSLVLHKSRPAFERAAEMGKMGDFELPELDYRKTAEISAQMFLKGLEA
ncbi:TetR/AcrR family transcriptional regulator [Limisalsivibrio acetivorans]|uniref:TetR/AcrR family transcriptional regulator n=1 Tax=Limisalsivibrio acetivorans TaxID=1304888 RepID=UPI0003B6C70E|nr:TetR/AcrR family transcriptional regulator [Limisalsivibrio acetivorans]